MVEISFLNLWTGFKSCRHPARGIKIVREADRAADSTRPKEWLASEKVRPFGFIGKDIFALEKKIADTSEIIKQSQALEISKLSTHVRNYGDVFRQAVGSRPFDDNFGQKGIEIAAGEGPNTSS